MSRHGMLTAGAIGLTLALAALHARAQTAPADAASSPPPPAGTSREKPFSFTFKPVVLDSGSTSGTSLGLDYDLKGKYSFAGSETGVGDATVSLDQLDQTFKSGQIDLRARGTLASSKEKNPNKLLDFTAAAVLKLDMPSAYVKLGGIFAFETDQGFDDKEHMFGVSASASKVRLLMAGDAGSVLLNYGSVKPTADTERQAAAGSLDSFRRWNAEVSYSVPINRQKVRSIDVDYRHYQEVNAPDAVQAAGLARHRIGLIRANLDQDFFLQYSRGSLPFDQRSERVIKIGWSAKFE